MKAVLATLFLLPLPTHLQADEEKSGTSTGADPATAVQLIEQLGDPDFAVRTQAELKLTRLGDAAFDALVEAETGGNAEAAKRASRLLERLRADRRTLQLRPRFLAAAGDSEASRQILREVESAEPELFKSISDLAAIDPDSVDFADAQSKLEEKISSKVNAFEKQWKDYFNSLKKLPSYGQLPGADLAAILILFAHGEFLLTLPDETYRRFLTFERFALIRKGVKGEKFRALGGPDDEKRKAIRNIMEHGWLAVSTPAGYCYALQSMMRRGWEEPSLALARRVAELCRDPDYSPEEQVPNARGEPGFQPAGNAAFLAAHAFMLWGTPEDSADNANLLDEAYQQRTYFREGGYKGVWFRVSDMATFAKARIEGKTPEEAGMKPAARRVSCPVGILVKMFRR